MSAGKLADVVQKVQKNFSLALPRTT